METRANYAIVGFFTLLVVLAAFGFVYWMSQFGRGGPTASLIVRIPGSANGLSVGSPVRFNGIPVGTVRGLSIDRGDPRFSVALTEVQADAPVYADTRAVLEIQGLTGAAYIELSATRNPEGKNILEESLQTGKPAVIYADLSSVTNLLATADKILKRADDAIGQIQTFVTDAREPLTQTVKNAQTFSQALSDNAEGVDKFLEGVSALSTTLTGLSGRLDSALSAVEDLVRAVDSKKIDSILANADKVSQDLAKTSADLPETVASFRRTAQNFETFGTKAGKALDRVDALIAAIDTQKVGVTVDNISAAATSIRGVADDIGTRRAEIDRAIANFSDMSGKLNAASNRVDGILVKVDGLLGSDDSQSVMVQARATLESFKKMADNLNAQIGPITANLSRFSGTGLRDLQTLITDTRRTMQNLDTTISNFDRNPQRLLFGGETVKQYDGRARR